MAAEHFHDLSSMGAPPFGTPEFAEWAAEDLRPTILAVVWVFLGLCNLFVGLRLYVRLRVYKRLLDDDWWLTGGMSAGLMSAILATIAVSNGNGRHMPVLSQDDREGVILWTTVAFCPGILFFGLPKLAALTLVVRLLDPKKWLRRFLWSIVIISQLSFICLICLVMGRCRPFKSLYKLDVEGHCMSIKVVADFGVYVGALSALVDVILAVYPAVVLFRMPMSLRRRIGLTASLGLGAIGGAIAIYKTLIISDGLSHPDFSYHSAAIIIWTTVEGSTVIMAASIPVFAPLVDMMLKGRNPFRRSNRDSKPYTNLKNQSLEMSSRSFSDGSAERGLSNFSESQVDILAINRDAAGTPFPGPGQILCTNEINITYEEKPLMDPLEAMLRGYDTATWKGW